jgi:hypothetical protein
LNAEDVMRSCDFDFDGFIGMEDLKKTLVQYFEQDIDKLKAVQMERLFKLLDQHKTAAISISDIQAYDI